jgi:YihY family inner membrane protein
VNVLRRRAHPALGHLQALWRDAYEANATGLAGMVAYNLLLSIFPFALLVLFVVGQVASNSTAEAHIVREILRLFPQAAEGTVDRTLVAVRDHATSIGILALVGGLWVGTSFWGAMDTAFCRIYRLPCRSWVHQKLFALAMIVVAALFLTASIALPALQGAVLVGADRVLPFQLAHLRAFTVALGLAGGVAVLFVVTCVIYLAVPRGRMPWRATWPGALLATLGMTIVNWAFPFYLTDVSTIGGLGTGLGFLLIVLVWFYVVALILLLGAVLNSSRLHRERPSPA